MSHFNNSIKSLTAALLISVVCLVVGPASTHASDYESYGAFSVCNPTKVHIHYQVRWGS